MGYVRHDAVIVTTKPHRGGGLPDINAFRESLSEEYRRLVIGPIETAVEGTVCYVFLPDGSKEEWPESHLGDLYRSRFRNLFRSAYPDGSSHDDVVSIAFGGDYGAEFGVAVTAVWPR